MSDLEIATVNPYDPPERQTLELLLQDDTRLEHQTHTTIQQEQHLAAMAQQAGYPRGHTDTRIHDLEHAEQVMAGHVMEDQQAIDHWDHAHPGWDQPTASAAETSSDPSAADAGAATGDGSNDGGDGGEAMMGCRTHDAGRWRAVEEAGCARAAVAPTPMAQQGGRPW